MDKEKDLTVHQPRSTQSAISDGYRLYARHFGHLLKSSWPAAIIYAMALGAAMAYYFSNVLPTMLSTNGTMQPPTATAAKWAALMALYGLTVALFICAAGFAPLREHEQTGTISRPPHWWGRWPMALTGQAIVVGLWLMVAGAAGGAVVGLMMWGLIAIMGTSATAAPIVTTITCTILMLVLTVALLPLSISSIDCMMEKKFTLAPPVKGYKKAMGHIGRLFMTALVVWIVAGVTSALIQMPCIILALADVTAMKGVAHGDPLDMPQPLFWFNFATFALGGLLQAYIHLTTLFPFYYQWGSIKEQEQENNNKS